MCVVFDPVCEGWTVKSSDKPSGGADHPDEQSSGATKKVAKVLAAAAVARAVIGGVREGFAEHASAEGRTAPPLPPHDGPEPDRPRTPAEPRPVPKSLWNPKNLWALL